MRAGAPRNERTLRSVASYTSCWPGDILPDHRRFHGECLVVMGEGAEADKEVKGSKVERPSGTG